MQSHSLGCMGTCGQKRAGLMIRLQSAACRRHAHSEAELCKFQLSVSAARGTIRQFQASKRCRRSRRRRQRRVWIGAQSRLPLPKQSSHQAAAALAASHTTYYLNRSRPSANSMCFLHSSKPKVLQNRFANFNHLPGKPNKEGPPSYSSPFCFHFSYKCVFMSFIFCGFFYSNCQIRQFLVWFNSKLNLSPNFVEKYIGYFFFLP